MEIKELAERAQNNDSGAWAELFGKTKDMVYFTALKLCGNKQNAEDIVQETYIKAMENISSLRAPEAFVTWLRMIAVNTARNQLAKTSPAVFGSDESDEILLNTPEVEEDFLPAEYASKRETARIIMRIIDSLPEKQRIAVILYYYNEVPVAEIARMMNVSENTVKSRLNYARAQIKEQVEELEKKGTKLHGAVPFLTLALGEAAKDYILAEEAATAIAATLAAGATAAAATATAATATTAATTAATTGILAKIAALPLATKVIAVVLGAAVVLGGAAAAVGGAVAVGQLLKDDDKPSISDSTPITTEEPMETTVPVETEEPVETTEAPTVVIPAEKALLYTFKQNDAYTNGLNESYIPYIKMYSDGTFEGLANIYYATVKVEGTWRTSGDGNYTMSVNTPKRTYEFATEEFNLYYNEGSSYGVVTFYPGDSMGITVDGATFDFIGETPAPNANTNEGAHKIFEEFRLNNHTNSDGSKSYAYADVTHDGIEELIVMTNSEGGNRSKSVSRGLLRGVCAKRRQAYKNL